VFLNSHLLGEVEATCDRVAFVKEGRVVHERSLAESSTPDVEVAIRMTDDTGRLVGADVLEGLARFGQGLEVRDGTVSLRVASEDALPVITRWLVEHGVRVYGINARRQSLEDEFLAIMGDDQRPG